MDTSPGPERTWAAAAAAALRKSGRLAADAPDSAAWDRLARRTVEGLVVPSLGTAERAAGLETARALESPPGTAPFLRGSTVAGGAAGGWDVRVLIADPDPVAAGRSVLADLQGGATSLWIRTGDGGSDCGDLSTVLADVPVERVAVTLQGGGPDAGLAGATSMAGIARARSVRLHPNGNVGFDPIGHAIRARPRSDCVADAAPEGLVTLRALQDFLSVAQDLGVAAVVVDGTAAHEAGAGDAAEVGYTLAVGVTYLRALSALDVEVDAACRLIEFRYAATDDQFATIAKLRAARLAWHRIAQVSGVSPDARAQRQHAVTSSAMLTRYDPWVNLLRGTVAAFASGVGGAQAVTVLPFDSASSVPDEFGRRLARNTSALLLGESHAGVVADPAGGADAVEMLTATIAAAAWAEFSRIEAIGGIVAALSDGSLTKRWAGTAAERDRRIATRRQPITGVSEFPDAAGKLPVRRTATAASATRWAAPFEALRDEPAGRPILLIVVGSPAAASARLLFTRNLLAAGGISVSDADPAADPADPAGTADAVAAAVDGSGCNTVILVGADADYATGAQTVAQAARRGGAASVFLAGRPTAVLAALPDGLIDGTVASGDDVLAFLRRVRAALSDNAPREGGNAR